MYQYRILMDVYGGEVTVGSVPSSTFDYWSKKDKTSFESHLVLDEGSDVQDKHNLFPWFERDDLIHTHGVELSESNRIKVIEDDTSTTTLECDLDQTWIKDCSWVINNEPHVLEKETVIMTCASWEKGTWEYGLIESEKPFDQSKLEFFLYHIDGMFIVDHLKYDDVEIRYNDSSTRGVGFDVWFD